MQLYSRTETFNVPFLLSQPAPHFAQSRRGSLVHGVQSEYGAYSGRVRGRLLRVEDKRHQQHEETQVHCSASFMFASNHVKSFDKFITTSSTRV